MKRLNWKLGCNHMNWDDAYVGSLLPERRWNLLP